MFSMSIVFRQFAIRLAKNFLVTKSINKLLWEKYPTTVPSVAKKICKLQLNFQSNDPKYILTNLDTHKKKLENNCSLRKIIDLNTYIYKFNKCIIVVTSESIATKNYTYITTHAFNKITVVFSFVLLLLFFLFYNFFSFLSISQQHFFVYTKFGVLISSKDVFYMAVHGIHILLALYEQKVKWRTYVHTELFTTQNLLCIN